MKVSKTSIHRLTIEKSCSCQACREYSDLRCSKPLGEAIFTPCAKHAKGQIAEFAGEMLIEALDKEAETAVAVQTPTRMPTDGDNGGVQAISEPGGTVQAMGMTMPKIRTPRDPLENKIRTRPAPTGPRPQNTGNLNVAVQDLTEDELNEAGITMTGDIDSVPADAKVDALVRESIESLGDYLDAQDAKEQGVPLSMLRKGE